MKKRGIIEKFGMAHYPDGKKVSTRLPEAYQLATGAQNCKNCVFLKNNKCEYWKGRVRDEYWCKAWKAGVSVGIHRYDIKEQKNKIMASIRKRIKPENFSKQRPLKNVKNSRVRNRLVKNSSTGKLMPTNELNSNKVSKLKRGGIKRIAKNSSIGSLKRSRKK